MYRTTGTNFSIVLQVLLIYITIIILAL